MKLSRRELLGSAAVAGLLKAQSRTDEPWLFIGGYAKGAGQGIWSCKFNTKTGKYIGLKLAVECANPSFLAVHPRKAVLYAVSEVTDFRGGGGALSSFRVDVPTGKLSLINQVSTKGNGPCHLSVDRTASALLAANYGGGSLVACPIKADGSLGEAATFIQLKGKGPNARRQESSHAHCIVTDPGNRYALATDLGADELRVYKLDASSAKLTPHTTPVLKLTAGSGPRHVTYTPDARSVLVVNELDSTLALLDWRAAQGELKLLDKVSTLPKDYKGTNSTAEVVVNRMGDVVYVSNRGHNSIAVFRIVDGGKHLNLVQHMPTRGKTPRNFVIDPTGRWLLVANQESDNLSGFAILPTGMLEDGDRPLKTPQPTCLRFA